MKSKMRKLRDGSIEIRLPTTPAVRRHLESRFENLRRRLGDPTLDDGLCLGLLMLEKVVAETESELHGISLDPWTSRSIEGMQVCGQSSRKGIDDRNFQA